jgi:hypothetical protein
MRKIIFAAFLLFSLPLAAQEPPQCTEAREGQLACMAGKQCACRFIPGGSMTGRPDRFAWDCGINRPNCPPDPNIVQQPGYAPPIGGVWVNPPNFTPGPGPGPMPPRPGPGPR